MSRLLRVGDVFLIEKGQTLYAGRNEQEVVAGEPTCHEVIKPDETVGESRRLARYLPFWA